MAEVSTSRCCGTDGRSLSISSAVAPRIASAGEVPGIEGAQVLQMGDDPVADGFIAVQNKYLYLGQLRPREADLSASGGPE